MDKQKVSVTMWTILTKRAKAMTTTKTSVVTEDFIELAPSYRIPLVLIVVGIPLLLLQPFLSLLVSGFGLFLMFQTIAIRLRFTATDLDVYRNENLLRRFPYSSWLNWRIFWSSFPVLFYFREVKSIHFLPVLFDAQTLTTCLEKYCPRK